MNQVKVHHAQVEECEHCHECHYYTYNNYLHGQVTLCALHLLTLSGLTAFKLTPGQADSTFDHGP